MKASQIFSIINLVNKQTSGTSEVVITDLSGLISLGDTVLSSATTKNEWLGTLIDRIGKTVISGRSYTKGTKKYSKESFEFGACLQKIYVEPMDAVENKTFGQVNGASVDQYVITKPTVKQKIFSDRTVWEIDVTVHDFMLKQAFTSLVDMTTFISAIFQAVENSLEEKSEGMDNMCLANFMANRLISNKNAQGKLTVINLLTDYNTEFTQTLTQAKALTDVDFLKYASSKIELWVNRLTRPSVLFNTENYKRHTPTDFLNISVLADFATNMKFYLESDTFNSDLVKLPTYDAVPYWQGTGTKYDFDDTSKIHVTTGGLDVEQTGIIALLTDNEALGTFQERKAQTSARNERGEFTNYFNKMEVGYFNDLSENGIVFLVADTTWNGL